MNTQRAKEIATSPDMKNVTFDNVPIYIQHVDEKSETARIYPLGEPDVEQNVSVEQLIEH